MIKFMANRDNNRKILGLVITKDNVDYLVSDKPIHINAEEMNLPYFKINEITIMYFETDDEALKFFKEKDKIGPKTRIHDTSKRKKQ